MRPGCRQHITMAGALQGEQLLISVSAPYLTQIEQIMYRGDYSLLSCVVLAMLVLTFER